MSKPNEYLDELHIQYKNIVHHFAQALSEEKNEYIRDSAIKRFELAFELSWKLLKSFIEEYHGVICRSPRTCIREAYKLSILDYDDYWLKITDLRNKTAHIYNLEMADEIFSELPEVLKRFEKLLEFMDNSIGNDKQ